MKIKTLVIFIALLVPLGTLTAQHSLQKETNAPRIGDEYEKTEMEFFPIEKNKDNGKKEKKSWVFLELKEKDKTKTYKVKIKTGKEEKESIVEEILPDYTVTHFEDPEGNLMTGENNTLYLRRLIGDSLLKTGYETPNQRVRYLEPLNGLFNINAPVNRDSILKSGEPSDIIATDTYRWYEEGYRQLCGRTIVCHENHRRGQQHILRVQGQTRKGAAAPANNGQRSVQYQLRLRRLRESVLHTSAHAFRQADRRQYRL